MRVRESGAGVAGVTCRFCRCLMRVRVSGTSVARVTRRFCRCLLRVRVSGRERKPPPRERHTGRVGILKDLHTCLMRGRIR